MLWHDVGVEKGEQLGVRVGGSPVTRRCGSMTALEADDLGAWRLDRYGRPVVDDDDLVPGQTR